MVFATLDHLRLGTLVLVIFHGVKWHHQLDMFVPYNLGIYSTIVRTVSEMKSMLKCQRLKVIESDVHTVLGGYRDTRLHV